MRFLSLYYTVYCLRYLLAAILHTCCTFIIILQLFFFFFFQAEDGIRDLIVTGVQTCALPISTIIVHLMHEGAGTLHSLAPHSMSNERLLWKSVLKPICPRTAFGRSRPAADATREVVERWLLYGCDVSVGHRRLPYDPFAKIDVGRTPTS